MIKTINIITFILLLSFLFGCTTKTPDSGFSAQDIIDMNNRINAGPIDVQRVKQVDINNQPVILDYNKIDAVHVPDVNYVLYTSPDINYIIIETDNGDATSEVQYKTNSKINIFEYYLYGQKQNISFEVYEGINNYLKSIYSNHCSKKDNTCSRNYIDISYINEPQGLNEIKQFSSLIKQENLNISGQARIAISIVQNIPYDYTDFICTLKVCDMSNNNCFGGECIKIYGRESPDKYPYQVLYNNKGVCGEKSRLLASILKDLGYEVVLFSFDKENHEAVGIKCQEEYSYLGTGYCFIESTVPSIITDSFGDYVGAGKLTSFPEIIKVSNGIPFDATEDKKMLEFYNNLSNQIDVLGKIIDNLEIKTDEAQTRLNSISIDDVSAYNVVVDEYNSYNRERNRLIDEDAGLIEKYNSSLDGNYWAFYNKQ